MRAGTTQLLSHWNTWIDMTSDGTKLRPDSSYMHVLFGQAKLRQFPQSFGLAEYWTVIRQIRQSQLILPAIDKILLFQKYKLHFTFCVFNFCVLLEWLTFFFFYKIEKEMKHSPMQNIRDACLNLLNSA